MSNLNSKAMIVTLNVSCWTARKQDKKVSAEVDKAHNARDAGRYNKLLVDKVHLDPLTSFAGQIRNYHYKMTLPWMDNGGRLLPSKLFMEYRNEMDRLKNEYDRLVSDFLREYDPKLINDARVRLGTMYEPEDYPPASDLRNKFGVETDIMPVPDAKDFRVDVADSEIKRIQAEISEKVALRQRQAVAEAWTRVRDTVTTIHTRLSADKPIIRESLIENARELAMILPSLNINDDPVMDSVARGITDNLLVNLWTLRNSSSARQRVAASAQSILNQIPTSVS